MLDVERFRMHPQSSAPRFLRRGRRFGVAGDVRFRGGGGIPDSLAAGLVGRELDPIGGLQESRPGGSGPGR